MEIQNQNPNKQVTSHVHYFAPKLLWLILGILSLVLVASATALYRSQLQTSKSLSIGLMPVHKSSVASSDWKTYTNSQYGFSLMYPGNLAHNESKSGIYFSDSGRGENGFSIIINNPGFGYGEGCDGVRTTTKIIDNISMDREDLCDLIVYTIKQNDHQSYIVINQDLDHNLFDQILSTFKFMK